MNMHIAAGMLAFLACTSCVSLSESPAPTNDGALVSINVNHRWTYQQLFAALERWGVGDLLEDDQIMAVEAEQKKCSFTADFHLLPKRTAGAWIGELAVADGVVRRASSREDPSPHYIATTPALDRGVQEALRTVHTLAVTNIIGHQAIRFVCQKAGVSCVLSASATNALAGETTLDYAKVPLSDVLSNECQRVGLTWRIQTGCLLFIEGDEKAAEVFRERPSHRPSEDR